VPTNIKAKVALARLWLDAGKAFMLLAETNHDPAQADKSADHLNHSLQLWENLRDQGKLAPLYRDKPNETKRLLAEARELAFQPRDK